MIVKMRSRIGAVMVTAALGALCHARAAEPSFNNLPLPPISYTAFFKDSTNYYSAGDAHFVIKDGVDEDIRKGIEIRVFSVSVPGSDPQPWEMRGPIAKCRVYLSLVYRPSRRVRDYLLSHHELTMPRMEAAAGWLPFIDDKGNASGYYLFVVEPVTAIDPPSPAAYDASDMSYEFIRLNDAEKGEYFNKGLRVTLSGISGNGETPARLADDVKAFKAAAIIANSSLHCYSPKPPDGPSVAMSQPTMQVAALQSCVQDAPPAWAYEPLPPFG